MIPLPVQGIQVVLKVHFNKKLLQIICNSFFVVKKGNEFL